MRGKLLVCISFTCLAGVNPIPPDLPSDEFIWDSGPYTPESAATIKAEANLIEVPVTVRDRARLPVGGLKKEDFLLFDNGKRQTISTFEVLTGPADRKSAPSLGAPGAAPETPATAEPRYVAFFFDDVNTKFANIHEGQDSHADFVAGREGAIKLVQKGLEPGERIGIFTASRAISVDFTDDARLLLDTLAKLREYPRMQDQPVSDCLQLDTYQAWAIVHLPPQTAEWDAAYKKAVECWTKKYAAEKMNEEAEEKLSIAEGWVIDTMASLDYTIRRLSEEPGRRILLLTSEGFVTKSFNYRQQALIDEANSRKVVINSLSTAGLFFDADPKNKVAATRTGGLIDPMNDSLASLAYDTGGQFFYNNNDLTEGFREMSAPPSVSYLLGFSPENLKADGSRHRLSVKLADTPHVEILARTAYFAPGGELTAAEKKARRLDEIVTAPGTVSEIPVDVKVAASAGEAKISVHTDVSKLPFRKLSGRQVERLVFVTALFEAGGDRFLSGLQGVLQLQLKEASFQQLAGHGLDTNLSIHAPAGTYRVRQVVQEIGTGRLASIDRTIAVR